MRRLTGTYDGTRYVIVEYGDGQVTCPPQLREALQESDGSLPTGADLEQACRLLFGDSFQVQEF